MTKLFALDGLLSVRPRTRRRLFRDAMPDAVAPTDKVVPVIGRYRVWPWAIAAAVGLAVWLAFGFSVPFAAAVALIVGLLLAQAESYWAEQRTARVEQQLADAIDLMVGALSAGASATVALDRAGHESAQPLRRLLADGMARVRFGADPVSVMRRLEAEVPTESFRLFATTMSVHFEVGGSLAPTLAVVGRVLRDRIEVGRRVRSLTAQARVSTVMLLLTTYFIAVLMWRQNPGRVRLFVTSPAGSLLVAASMVMQAIGVVWQALASRNIY